jgi:hypothetical protein
MPKKYHPFRAIFSGDMKDFLQGVDLNKIPLEFVTKVIVNFSDGKSFSFKPSDIEYETEAEFLSKLGDRLRRLKNEINFVDFYIDSSKLKESVKAETRKLFDKIQ